MSITAAAAPGPDQVDWREIDKWVASGAAPKMLIVTREHHKLSRPLCAYPTKAVYKGEGDTTKAESFTCR